MCWEHQQHLKTQTYFSCLVYKLIQFRREANTENLRKQLCIKTKVQYLIVLSEYHNDKKEIKLTNKNNTKYLIFLNVFFFIITHHVHL